jgi:hypothetical protein
MTQVKTCRLETRFLSEFNARGVKK